MTMHWRLSAWYFFYFAYIGAFAPYFTLYLQSLGFSAWDIGLLMSMGPVMRLVAPTFWGALSDRSGRRVPIVRLSAVLSALAFLSFFNNGSGAVLAGIGWRFLLDGLHPLIRRRLRACTAGRRNTAASACGITVGFVVAVLCVGVVLVPPAVALPGSAWPCRSASSPAPPA
jgi:PPP family 3-phenylpropionic acid transporter